MNTSPFHVLTGVISIATSLIDLFAVETITSFATMLKKTDNRTYGNVSFPLRYSSQCRIFVCAYRPRYVARSVRFICDPAFVDGFSDPFLVDVLGVVDNLSIRIGMLCVFPSMTGSIYPWLHLDSILADNHGEGRKEAVEVDAYGVRQWQLRYKKQDHAVQCAHDEIDVPSLVGYGTTVMSVNGMVTSIWILRQGTITNGVNNCFIWRIYMLNVYLLVDCDTYEEKVISGGIVNISFRGMDPNT